MCYAFAYNANDNRPRGIEDSENNQTILWLKRNPRVLNRIILDVWTKWEIDFRHKEGQQDENINLRPTKYKVCQVNRTSYTCGKG